VEGEEGHRRGGGWRGTKGPLTCAVTTTTLVTMGAADGAAVVAHVVVYPKVYPLVALVTQADGMHVVVPAV